MATLKEYFELDFNHTIKVLSKIDDEYNETIIKLEAFIHFDFISNSIFFSFFIPNNDLSLDFFKNLLGKCYSDWFPKWEIGKEIFGPASNLANGYKFQVHNTSPFVIKAKYPGEEFMSSLDLQFYGRIFIYTKSHLNETELLELKKYAKKEFNFYIQFRSPIFSMERGKLEKPYAFICHDTRDKKLIARPLAEELISMGCPVWFDEYSLKVGSPLRESIEKGIKECPKCILILTPNFFNNNGWTKTEFNSIFTRQILEEKNLVLPIWHEVTKDDVYNYSPSLLNILGLQWNEGKKVVARELFSILIPDFQR